MTTAQKIEEFIISEIMITDRDKRLDYDENLLDSGVLDSLSLLRLITFVEDNFGVKIDDEEIVPDNFKTINMTANLVESKRK